MAPSWANTQPWEFAIVGREKLEEIKQVYLERAAEATEEPAPDLAAPREFPEPFDNQRRTVGWGLFEIMGIGGRTRKKESSGGYRA